jgi:hypothetical protein
LGKGKNSEKKGVWEKFLFFENQIKEEKREEVGR